MTDKYTAKVIRIFYQSVDQIWEALTNPELVKKYFYETNLKSDFKVGSPITFSGTWNDKEYVDGGVIKEIEPKKKLVYTYYSSLSELPNKPENYSLITYELLELKGNQAELAISQTCLNDAKKEESETGWNLVLDGMEKILGKKF